MSLTSMIEQRKVTAKSRDTNLRILKWFAIVLPVLFLILTDVLRHTALEGVLHNPSGFLATHVIMIIAVVLFANSVFGLMDRFQRRISEQNQQLSALNNMAAAAAEKLNLEEMLGSGLEHVLNATKADAGLICLVDIEEQEHSPVCHRGFSPEMVKMIRKAKLKDDPIANQVVSTGRPVTFGRVLQDPKVTEAARRSGIKSGISAPLKSDGKVNGILVIATRQERRFSDVDQEFLEGIGGQLGLAIRNATLYEQSQLQNRELSALLAVGRTVTSSFDLDEILRGALDTIIEVTTADAAEIWLADGDDEVVMRAHRGIYEEAFLEKTSFRLGEGIPGNAAQSGEPIVVHDLPSDARFMRQAVSSAGIHTYCALPISYRGRMVGVLAVAALSNDAMKEPWELRLLEGIGERIAVAIENAHLHQQVQDIAVLQERERIAREMHDGLGQVLGYINTQTLAVKKLISDECVDEASIELTNMEEAARTLYAEVREGILGLRTAPHRDEGLIPALEEYIERYGEMSGIKATLHISPSAGPLRLLPSAEIQLMRIVQEALSNVRKHARASAVDIEFRTSDCALEVKVSDDGQGFDPARIRSAGWPRFGLQTMRERAESVGGTFDIETVPGHGTQIVVCMPLKAERESNALI